jgi:hypothetical protein
MSKDQRDIYTREDVLTAKLNGSDKIVVCPRSIFTSVAVECAQEYGVEVVRVCTCVDRCYEKD